MATLWPSPASVVPGTARSSHDNVTTYTVLPSERKPTLVLPRRPRRAAATAIVHYKTAADARTRAKLRALATAARVGLTDVMPSAISVVVPHGRRDEGIDGYLSEVLGQSISVCLYVGPHRAVQKPVLQVIGARGDHLGFAKVGVNDLTRRLVRGEAETLQRLASRSFSYVTPPRCLHHGQWNGHEVLVQETLSGGTRLPEAPVDAALEIAQENGIDKVTLSESPFWQRIVHQLAAGDDPYSAELGEIAALVADSAGNAEIPVGSWHGDFAPWNMSRLGSRVQIWDWEHFGSDVPLGFDLLHHRAQTLLMADRTAGPVPILEAVGVEADAVLRPAVDDEDTRNLVATLYLVELAARYLREGEHEAGTRMGAVDAWLPLIRRRTAALSSGDRS
jgi:hypothetical protein